MTNGGERLNRFSLSVQTINQLIHHPNCVTYYKYCIVEDNAAMHSDTDIVVGVCMCCSNMKCFLLVIVELLIYISMCKQFRILTGKNLSKMVMSCFGCLPWVIGTVFCFHSLIRSLVLGHNQLFFFVIFRVQLSYHLLIQNICTDVYTECLRALTVIQMTMQRQSGVQTITCDDNFQDLFIFFSIFCTYFMMRALRISKII